MTLLMYHEIWNGSDFIHMCTLKNSCMHLHVKLVTPQHNCPVNVVEKSFENVETTLCRA